MDKTLLILGLLRGGPLYGYRLHQIIRAHGELYAFLKKANLYYLLDRLAADGYLSMQVEPGARGSRRERVVYTLTEQGQARFDTLLRSTLRTYEQPHTGITTAVVFLAHFPPTEAIALLKERRAVVVAHRAQVVAELGSRDSRGLLASIAADHLLSMIDTERDWLDRSLARLRDTDWATSTDRVRHAAPEPDTD